MCWYKNAGVAGYAEAFRPVQSDSQTSEWYSYFENDVLVIYPAAKECMNNCTFGERDSIIIYYLTMQELIGKSDRMKTSKET